MIRAVAYCRVSTDKEDQLNSLAAQEEFFKGYCKNHGYTLVKIYSDEGLSGTKKNNRKAFLQMLEDAQENKFDYLLVKDISRLARNIIDSIETIRYLKRHIQKVIFINQPNLTDDEFVLGIMGLIAQQESENMSKRIKFGKRMNMEKGKVPNLVYGYDKIAGDNYNLIINEQEANVVKKIFHYYTHGGYGCSTIANMLNEEGIRTKKGAKWQQITVARILKNPIYIGRVINGKQEMVEIYSYDRKKIPEENWYISEKEELAIIEEAIFNEAQRILEGRHDAFVHKKERSSNRHLFSTLIKCGECGSSFRRLPVRNENKTANWGCNKRNYYGVAACSNAKQVKEDDLIEAIQTYLCDLYSKRTDMMKWTRDEFKKLYSQNIQSERSKKNMDKELTELKTKYERQVSMCEKGLISFEEFEKRSLQVKKKIKELEYDLRHSEKTVDMETTLKTVLHSLFKDIKVTLSADVFTNQMLKKIIDFIEVCPDGKVKIYMTIFGGFNGKIDIHNPNCNSGT